MNQGFQLHKKVHLCRKKCGQRTAAENEASVSHSKATGSPIQNSPVAGQNLWRWGL